MQTCSKCHASSPDLAPQCSSCGVDLCEWSESAVALKQLQENPRVIYVRVLCEPQLLPGLPSGGRRIREGVSTEASGRRLLARQRLPVFLSACVGGDLPLI